MNFNALLHQEDVLIERITNILSNGDQILSDTELQEISELRDAMIENKKAMEKNPFFHSLPTVANPLLFSNKHAWVHVVIMGSIILIVMLGLLVMVSLQYPFTGEIRIEPEAFRQLLDSFHQRQIMESVSVGS